VDPTVIVLPGAQALVTQILTDGWVHARAWLARRLGHSEGDGDAQVELRLDAAQAQAAALAVPGEVPQRALLEAYWAGYLAALVGEHPELSAAVAGLTAPSAERTADRSNFNSVTGTVTGNVVQARDIHGGIKFS
jgi:hypothetical protein